MQVKNRSPLCKPYTIEIVREIPLNIKKTLQNLRENEIDDLKVKVLDYLQEPRNIEQIKEFVGLGTTRDAVRRHFITPMINQGLIKRTNENNHGDIHQRYIRAEVEITQEMKDSIKEQDNKVANSQKEKILEFCKEPRGIKEIIKHLESKTAPLYVRQLREQGKLRYTIPNNPYSQNQKYINSEINYNPLTDDEIIEYCKEPRTKQELETKFGLTKWTRKIIVERLLNIEKICYTEESLALGKCDGNRRLIANG